MKITDYSLATSNKKVKKKCTLCFFVCLQTPQIDSSREILIAGMPVYIQYQLQPLRYKIVLFLKKKKKPRVRFYT